MTTPGPNLSLASPTSSSNTPKSAAQDNDRLPAGSVAGIVIGVAVAVALTTFLITFFTVRHSQDTPAARLRKPPKPLSGRFGLASRNTQDLEKRSSVGLGKPREPTFYEVHLPQAADDSTIKKRTATFLDRIELHVENFYRKTPVDAVQLSEEALRQLDAVETGQLSRSIAALAPHTKNMLPIVKHTLAYMATSAISLSTQPKWSLLPKDIALIPRSVAMSDAPGTTRSPTQRCLSRWRVLTAYLRPDPSQDATYIAERNSTIEEMVNTFSTAFSPWKNVKYVDEQRSQSLDAILKDAADLGIWLSAQPSELQFRWPNSTEAAPRDVVVAPWLAKVTDEQGEKLSEPFPLTKTAIQAV